MNATKSLFSLLASLAALSLSAGCSDSDSSTSSGASPEGQAGQAGAGQAGSGQAGQAGSQAAGGSGGGAGQGAGGAAGAGQAGAGQAGSGGQGQPPSKMVPFACASGAKIQPGLNDGFMVKGKARKFYADFPKETSKPLAVVFSFHGYGDKAENWRMFGPLPDTDAEMPFVLVTPESTGLNPYGGQPQGLDWQIFSGKSGEDNIEGDLVEEVLGCLAASNSVDGTRLYSMGFSAGAILTNLLYSRYPDLWAATLAFSGAWFSDEAEVKGVNTLGLPINFSWSPLAEGPGAMMLLTHGGPTDQFGQAGQTVLDFEKSYQMAQTYLTGLKKPFIDCAHTTGHNPHPQVGPDVVVSYFKAHQAGAPSPYVTAGKLDATLPASCTLHAGE